MNGHGGARTNAGRKPKAERFATKIAAAEKRIADRLPDLVDAMMDLALGVQVEKTDDEGNSRVYTSAPNQKAAEYCLNRILGRPAAEDEAEKYQAVVEEIIGRVVGALEGVDPEIREQVKSQLAKR